jgi:hypothetical protein
VDYRRPQPLPPAGLEDHVRPGIGDPDGLLLDGRSVFFDSPYASRGGGKVHTRGAIKVCSLGTMFIADSIKPIHMKVWLDSSGYIYKVWKDAEQAGFKDEAWCKAHLGFVKQ